MAVGLAGALLALACLPLAVALPLLTGLACGLLPPSPRSLPRQVESDCPLWGGGRPGGSAAT
eukprot:8361798-Alexandrium_andersonii.AAC.1